MRRPHAMLILLSVASLDAACDADFMPEKTGCSPAGSACDGDRDCVPFTCTCATASKSGTVSLCSSGKCSTNPCASLCGSNGILASVEQPVPARCPAVSRDCGDGKCESSKGETCSSCAKDCGTCYGVLCDNHPACSPLYCDLIVGYGRGYCTKNCTREAECAYPGSIGVCSEGMCLLKCLTTPRPDGGAGTGCPPGLSCNSYGVCVPS